MELIELTENDREEYNNFVAAQESGSFLQAWEWGEWQCALGRTVYRFKIIDERGEQVASVQLIKMPLPMGKYYLYCPYGPVVGYEFLLSKNGNSSSVLSAGFEGLFKKLVSKYSDAVFIRVEPKFGILDLDSPGSQFKKTANIQPGKTLVIDLSKSEEQLLAEMHHKTRYNIKLAKKHNVEIKDEFEISTGHGLFFEEAINLIVGTSKRQGYQAYGEKYYRRMIDYLMLRSRGDLKLHIYKAIFQNQLLSTAIIVDFAPANHAERGYHPAERGGTRTFLFGGSSEFHKNVMAPYLLHFQAMVDAKNLGLSTYDFWGIETAKGATPGFVRFKLGFAHSTSSGSSSGIKQYAGAYDLVMSPTRYMVYKLVRWLNRLVSKITFAIKWQR